MKTSEAYSFIGHIFALDEVKNRRSEILTQLNNDLIDWNKVVELASEQLVLPLMYVKLRDSDLLEYLPEGLTPHLEMVYELNLKRNKQLIDQANEIARCLTNAGIKPIFIKGMANLLSGLYNDLGERMMLDIDFLVEPALIEKAAYALQSIGYNTYTGKMFWDKSTKHYPRLTNPNRISDIEMHFNPASKKACIDNYGFDVIKLNGVESDYHVLPAYSDALKITFLHAMIDNKGYQRAKISLRDIYDLYRYSQIIEINSFHISNKQTRIFRTYLFEAQLLLGLEKSLTPDSGYLFAAFCLFHSFNLNYSFSLIFRKTLNFLFSIRKKFRSS